MVWLTLLGISLRMIRIHTLPPAAWYDEVWFALRGREILTTSRIPIFFPTDFGGAAAGPAWAAALAQALGIGIITGGRMIVALCGGLSVPLGYACFRELFRAEQSLRGRWRSVALLAALVLAATSFVVISSRNGMEVSLVVPAVLLTVWQMLRACYPLPGKRTRRDGWVWAALASSAAQYNGLHARFILPVMAMVLLSRFLSGGRSQVVRLLSGAALMLAVGSLACYPLIRFFAANPQWLTARASFVSTAAEREFARPIDMYAFNAAEISRVFALEGAYDPKYSVPGAPLLDPLGGIGFAIGLIWCLAHLHSSDAGRLLPAWAAIACLPSLLTGDAPNLGRMSGIAAPLAGLVGVGWVALYDRLRHLAAFNPARRALVPLAVALLAANVAWQTWLTAGKWPQTPILREQFTAEPVDIARALLRRSKAEPVFVERIPETNDIAAFEWYFPGSSRQVARMDFRKCLPLPHRRSTRTSYLVITDRDDLTVEKLRELYPTAEIDTSLDLWEAAATLVEVPPHATAPLPSFQTKAVFASGLSLYGFDWSGPTVGAGGLLYVTLYWHTNGSFTEDLTAFAHLGTGLEGQAPLIAQHDGQPCIGFYPTSLWKPGEIVVDSFAIEIVPGTPAGRYPLAVGWYAYPSLERLTLLDADSALPDNRAVIGMVEVEAP